MSRFRTHFTRSTLPLLVVVCLAALSFTYAFADDSARPLAVTVIGDPDAAVNGRFAVGSASVGSKALTVTGVIDFLGAGTVHNYFTQGAGNNMQITTNVDEANTIGDASRSQWKLVLGSNLDWFSIRRSPAGGTYNEDALVFIEGSTGNVGIATVDTGNSAAIPFTFQARLHVETASGDAFKAVTTDTTTEITNGVYGQSYATRGNGLYGKAWSTTGDATGVVGDTYADAGYGVYGYARSTTGNTTAVYGEVLSSSGRGVFGYAPAAAGITYGLYGESASTQGRGVFGLASETSGVNYGVYGQSNSTSGSAVYGYAIATTGSNSGVFGTSVSPDGSGVYGYALAFSGTNYGVYGQSQSTSGRGVYGYASATSGATYGVYGYSGSPYGYGVYGVASTQGVYGLATGTGSSIGVWGQSSSTSGYGVYGRASATAGNTYGVVGESASPSGYGVFFAGGLAGTGTKSAIVETQDYGWRHLYAVESPQNWFEDFGQATLAAGEAVVSIEPIFAQTVNLDLPYHVFLTPLGDCPLYVAEKSASSFTVRAHEGAACEVNFDYRIIAPRLDYEDLRLKPAQDPQEMAASMPPAPPEIPSP